LQWHKTRFKHIHKHTHTETNEGDIYTVKAFFEENFGGGDREEREKEQREKARVSSPKRHGFVRV
jgi:hypothetical protein